MLLVITPDVLRYYQRYRVCTVPQEEVYFEHRELLRCVREKDEEGAVAMQRRHLKSLSEFAANALNDENHFSGIALRRKRRRTATFWGRPLL